MPSSPRSIVRKRLSDVVPTRPAARAGTLLVALLVVCVLGTGVAAAAAGGAPAQAAANQSTANVTLDGGSATPAAVDESTTVTHEVTVSVDDVSKDGSTDRFYVVLPDAVAGDIAPNSVSVTNRSDGSAVSITSSKSLVDGPDNDSLAETVTFAVSPTGNGTVDVRATLSADVTWPNVSVDTISYVAVAVVDSANGDLATTNVTSITVENVHDPAVHPPDPPTDTLGWEDGLWYNETISVDQSNGLNTTELDAVVARGMARVEYVRKLEFQRRVPVRVISRQQFAGDATNVTATRNDTLHQNVKQEAIFGVGEDTNAVQAQAQQTASSVLGYYSPSRQAIVIVSENTSSPKMDEITLSQELFHALQDQQFNLSRYDQSTREKHNAIDGIIEGDGNYVDYLYEQQCSTNWTCLRPTGNGSGGGGTSSIIWPNYFTLFQPYSDGPAFVQDIHQSQGWSGVNDVYANPPESTEQTIHPSEYLVDSPTNVTVADTSSGEWSVPDLAYTAGSMDTAEFGEAGAISMLVAPYRQGGPRLGAYAANTTVTYRGFLNVGPNGALDPVDPLNYDHPYTAGWDGDTLVPYARDDSLSTNETAYVWKFHWESATDAQEFETGYLHLLTDYRGADPVEGHSDTYRIPAGSAFSDAFWVHQDNATVTIVNAPTVGDLDEVRAGAAPSTGPGVVGNATNQPADPDGDGVYEDVNGDGRVDLVDVAVLYDNRNGATVGNSPAAFDFDGDGSFDLVDVSVFYNAVA